MIAVVHRLDIIKNFDEIGVMKSGKIKEMGTYDELMGNQGQREKVISLSADAQKKYITAVQKKGHNSFPPVQGTLLAGKNE